MHGELGLLEHLLQLLHDVLRMHEVLELTLLQRVERVCVRRAQLRKLVHFLDHHAHSLVSARVQALQNLQNLVNALKLPALFRVEKTVLAGRYI